MGDFRQFRETGGIKNGSKEEFLKMEMLVFQMVRYQRYDDTESEGRVSAGCLSGVTGVDGCCGDVMIRSQGVRMDDITLGVKWQCEGSRYELDQVFEGCDEGMGRVDLEREAREWADMLCFPGPGMMPPLPPRRVESWSPTPLRYAGSGCGQN